MEESSPVLDINEILNYLPHRPPFLLIDRVIDIQPYQSLTAIKNVTINEPFFGGHFPEKPIMPGVLILEALAQTATVFAFYSLKEETKDAIYLFAGIDKARFKRPVEPGDQLHLQVELNRARHDVWKVHATATVDDEVVCSADLMSVKQGLNT